jgi:hypothetical protein
MSSIRRRGQTFTVHDRLTREQVETLAFDVWEAIRDRATEHLGVEAPPLMATKMGIRYMRLDPESKTWVDVANGGPWTHAVFTLRGAIPERAEAASV